MKTWHAPGGTTGSAGLAQDLGGAARRVKVLPLRHVPPDDAADDRERQRDEAQITMITTIVPKERRLQVYAIATVLRKANVTKNGAGRASPTAPVHRPPDVGGRCAVGELRRIAPKAQNCAELRGEYRLRAHHPAPPNRRQ